MKKTIIIPSLLILSFGLFGQDDGSEIKEVDLDILRAPDSPAGNLLDISNEQINRPTDPSAFMTLIKQSSSDFSSLPTEFAVDFSPWLLFSPEKMTMESWLDQDSIKEENFWKRRLFRNIQNTLVVSFATSSLDSLEFDNLTSVRRVSTGLKFSILRGKKLDKDFTKQLNELKTNRDIATVKLFEKVDQLRAESKVLMAYENQREAIKEEIRKYDLAQRSLRDSPTESNKPKIDSVQQLKNFQIGELRRIGREMEIEEERISESAQEYANKDFEESKKIVENLKMTRYGFKLDFSAGLVYDFANENFDNRSFSKGGIWFTGGWETENNFSFFLLGRLLVNPDLNYTDDNDIAVVSDVNNLDIGGKVSFTTKNKKFNGGLEFIYRDYSKTEVEDGFRTTINLSYDIGKNKQLGIALGRDFDGTISKDGNVIAAMNVLLGFGGERGF